MNLEQYLDEIIKFLQSEVKKANAKGLIVGLSGGVDSAVVALLIKKAFPNDHLALIMPCFSPDIDLEYANNLVNIHKLNAKVVNLNNVFLSFKKTLETEINIEKSKLILGNLKARLRMNALYAYAQNHNYLVVGTDNSDEWHIGYFTKYGDGGVDLLPIIHLLKKDVFAAAKILKVSEEIIIRKPTAGLWDEQTDEMEMQFKYEQLDQYLLGNKSLIPSSVINKIEFMHQNSAHKRIPVPQAPKWTRKK
ncbi:NAD(+) synthase [Spiroplasma endosymbiont of Dactylopius coccus]